MKKMKTAAIREKFLRFFESKGHTVVPSSPLVPAGDSTLLFTNSGMVQFKDVFLGFDKRPYKTATTAQRCLRAGGKHNDLENVGYTARHHTFFEMLGNFSFGDYFKERAIPLAWEFLTAAEDKAGLGLEKEHLWVTVFGGGKLFGDGGNPVPGDDDSFLFWKEVLTNAWGDEKIAEKRITRVPTMDNFWMMGDTGPCGPCSEIFYDRDKDAKTFRGENEKFADDCVEIWNLVFMQYNRNENGELKNLPSPCVDTGMGLERIAAVMQGVKSNYEIDLFETLLMGVDKAIVAAGGVDCKGYYQPSHRIVADHIRAATFLVIDGVIPANEGRGYVLRRIMRRAMGYGYKLGAEKPFLHKLVFPVLPESVSEEYRMYVDKRIKPIISDEEKQFGKTLDLGVRELVKYIATHQFNDIDSELTVEEISELILLEMNFWQKNIDNRESWIKDIKEMREKLRRRIAKARTDGEKLPGNVAFKLYDTYGFPVDMTADQIRILGLTVDMEEFDRCMREQKERSRATAKFKVGQKTILYDGAPSDFYRDKTEVDAKILALFVDGEPVNESVPGDSPLIVLNRTPFYAESGGQIGDIGEIKIKFNDAKVIICDTQKIRNDVWGHFAKPLTTKITVDDEVFCAIDKNRRIEIARSHSAAHLMHAALRQVLGKHVEQRGSQVSAGHIRFDFSHNTAMTAAEMEAVEKIVCQQITANDEVQTKEMRIDDARKKGAMALFGEKYGDIVRVVTIDENFSIELCGGTHANRGGDIGRFNLINEQAIAAGIRRVEALTGVAELEQTQQKERLLRAVAEKLKSPRDKLGDKIEQLLSSQKELQKQLETMKGEKLNAQINEIIAKIKTIGDNRVLIEKVADADGKTLRDMALQLRRRLPGTALFLAAADGEKSAFVAAVDDAKIINAQHWMQFVADKLKIKGGGKADFAQAGGGKAGDINRAMDAATAFLRAR